MNLYGPVRANAAAGEGDTHVTIKFDSWKEIAIQSTTHTVVTRKPKRSGPILPPSDAIVDVLPHPDRKATVWDVRYSEDGQRLFTSGYPSGVLQFWDTKSWKEIHRIETPPGYRRSADYAQLTPNWETVYVSEERKREVIPIENNNKKEYNIKYSGQILRWNINRGEAIEPLVVSKDSGASLLQIFPDGKQMLCVELLNYNTSDQDSQKQRTSIFNLKTGQRKTISEQYATASFSCDKQYYLLGIYDFQNSKSTLTLRDTQSHKILVQFDEPKYNDKLVSAGDFSPDGKWIALGVAGQSGPKIEKLLLNAKTLKLVHQLEIPGEIEDYGQTDSAFSRDSQFIALTTRSGRMRLIDIASQKTVLELKQEGMYRFIDFDPTGRWLAISWHPNLDPALAGSFDLDPLDGTQTRIQLIDLKKLNQPPFEVMCPLGFSGKLAFSPDGKTLAMGLSGGTLIIDVAKATATK